MVCVSYCLCMTLLSKLNLSFMFFAFSLFAAEQASAPVDESSQGGLAESSPV